MNLKKKVNLVEVQDYDIQLGVYHELVTSSIILRSKNNLCSNECWLGLDLHTSRLRRHSTWSNRKVFSRVRFRIAIGPRSVGSYIFCILLWSSACWKNYCGCQMRMNVIGINKTTIKIMISNVYACRTSLDERGYGYRVIASSCTAVFC